MRAVLLLALAGCGSATGLGSPTCPPMPDGSRLESSEVVADTCYPSAVGTTGTAPGTFANCAATSECSFTCGSRSWLWAGDAWTVVIDGGAGCTSTIRVRLETP